MPFIAPKEATTSSSFLATLAQSVGHAKDIYALAYCPELDEVEKDQNPDHREFTFVLRYQPPQRTVVAKFPRRLADLWQKSDGTLLAVGDTSGLVEITSSGMVEGPLPNSRGVFCGIWGANDDEIFVVGVGPAGRGLAHYRQRGTWFELPFPEGTETIADVCGFAGNDVYFVGESGQVHHFDGAQVTRLRTPTRGRLTGIARLNDTEMCITGYQGTLLVGNRTRWHPMVTNTRNEILAIAALQQRLYFGVEGRVWSTDGKSPVAPAVSFPARWVSGLLDGLTLSHARQAKLFANGKLTDLDIVL